ncbi:pep a2 [Streptomyces scabichelini]|uniref:pep a2 n=1 Tax=Streptomyces scabichelini TaxID=2711217 RepID=UPI001F49B70F|nr:pep a2 [Streptomyces scabichelini]
MKTVVPCYYHLDVEVSPERVAQVRRILAAHLRYWNLEDLVEPVCHCTEVLLHTIDEHAVDKNTTIEMWWNGQHLITAVSDNDADLHPNYAQPGCLAHIAAVSDGWGCCATGAGGKIIWFSRRARAVERAPLVPTTPAPSLRESRPMPREAPMPALAGSAPANLLTAASGSARSRDGEGSPRRSVMRPSV